MSRTECFSNKDFAIKSIIFLFVVLNHLVSSKYFAVDALPVLLGRDEIIISRTILKPGKHIKYSGPCSIYKKQKMKIKLARHIKNVGPRKEINTTRRPRDSGLPSDDSKSKGYYM